MKRAFKESVTERTNQSPKKIQITYIDRYIVYVCIYTVCMYVCILKLKEEEEEEDEEEV